MFSALRESSPFYILRRGAGEIPVLQTGQVQSVSQPKPKFGTFPGQFGAETTVDVKVIVGNETQSFEQLPSQLTIANFGSSGIVVSESREAILAEVESIHRNSLDIVKSRDYHEKVAEACGQIELELNPQLRKEREQEERIAVLEGKIGGLDGSIAELKDIVVKALNKSAKN